MDLTGCHGDNPSNVLGLSDVAYDQGQVLNKGLISPGGIAVGTSFQFLYQAVVGGLVSGLVSSLKTTS